MSDSPLKNPLLRRALIVCALGYFIDVLDIQLFAVLRVPSLTDIGVSGDQLSVIGGYILNAQMLGMVLGAFLWGWLGDRYGRVRALYGSILIYSLGTLACSFVHNPLAYGWLRFVTGFGLAGETGAAVTLIAEMMSAQKRGWGMTLIAGFGFWGPVSAVLISWFLNWREIYVVTGLMGLLLLVLRMRLAEPALFEKARTQNAARGSLKLLANRQSAAVFFYCWLLGACTIYRSSILNFFSAELGKAVLGPTLFDQKTCLFLFYLGLAFGDLSCGVVSQLYGNRRKTAAAYVIFSAAVTLFFLLAGPSLGMSAFDLYVIYFLIGFGSGSWILFTTIAAEHFGTDIRATTATLLTNLARGATIPMVFAFQELRGVMSITDAAALIGGIFLAAALLGLSRLRETHGIDLDYMESGG